MTTQLDTLLAALVQAVLKTERSYTNLRDQRQREKCEAAETAALEAVRAHVVNLHRETLHELLAKQELMERVQEYEAAIRGAAHEHTHGAFNDPYCNFRNVPVGLCTAETCIWTRLQREGGL